MGKNLNIVAERRLTPRHSSNMRAFAVLEGGIRRGCQVSDVSSEGARLNFGAVAPLPLRFALQLPSGKCLKVQLIWQQDLVAGVRFNKPPGAWDRVILGKLGDV